MGSNELTSLDLVGWTLAATAPPTVVPRLQIVRGGANQFTLSWTNTATGFTLQERTNLASGLWLASATGSTNPAVIVSTNAQKFYRLYQPPPPAPALARAAVFDLATSPNRIHVHITHPGRP